MGQPDIGAIEDSFGGESLPDVLPESPFALVKSWFDEARERTVQPNPNAMSLATVDADGRPSVRIVLCKSMDVDRGVLVFYTNYGSRKAQALDAVPRAGVVMHWDELDRQIRFEGPVTRSPETESDAYFRSRDWEKRLGAWASDQSRPIASRDDLLAQLAERALSLGVDLAKIVDGQGDEIDIPRPPHWGGFRVWADRVEMWCAGTGRVHDRAVWSRELGAASVDGVPGFEGGPWHATRLQP